MMKNDVTLLKFSKNPGLIRLAGNQLLYRAPYLSKFCANSGEVCRISNFLSNLAIRDE